jgi:hypothetical protein
MRNVMNDIILDGSEWEHISNGSLYNRNFYRNLRTGEMVLEVCEELEGTFAFYSVEPGSSPSFMGRSENDITDGIITVHPDWD